MLSGIVYIRLFFNPNSCLWNNHRILAMFVTLPFCLKNDGARHGGQRWVGRPASAAWQAVKLLKPLVLPLVDFYVCPYTFAYTYTLTLLHTPCLYRTWSLPPGDFYAATRLYSLQSHICQKDSLAQSQTKWTIRGRPAYKLLVGDCSPQVIRRLNFSSWSEL